MDVNHQKFFCIIVYIVVTKEIDYTLITHIRIVYLILITFNVCHFSYQRVYVDEYDYEVPPTKFSRSNSFPDLRNLTIGGYVDNCIPHPRRRANSEVVPAVSD